MKTRRLEVRSRIDRVGLTLQVWPGLFDIARFRETRCPNMIPTIHTINNETPLMYSIMYCTELNGATPIAAVSNLIGIFNGTVRVATA